MSNWPPGYSVPLTRAGDEHVLTPLGWAAVESQLGRRLPDATEARVELGANVVVRIEPPGEGAIVILWGRA